MDIITLDSEYTPDTLARMVKSPAAGITEADALAVFEAMFNSGVVSAGDHVSTGRVYDVFMTAHRATGAKPDALKAYFELTRDSIETVKAVNPYSGLDFVFGSQVFEDEIMREIADAARIRTGPATQIGMYPCPKPKCKAEKEKTSANVKQTRRADEPPTIQNICNVCGHTWIIG